MVAIKVTARLSARVRQPACCGNRHTQVVSLHSSRGVPRRTGAMALAVARLASAVLLISTAAAADMMDVTNTSWTKCGGRDDQTFRVVGRTIRDAAGRCLTCSCPDDVKSKSGAFAPPSAARP